MTNLEKYKNEISLNGINRTLGCVIHKLRRGSDCKSDNCRECNRKSLDWLSEEYQEPKIKLTKLEYDILTSWEDYNKNFSFYGVLTKFKEKGNFKDVKDTTMKISDILANCEVVEK